MSSACTGMSNWLAKRPLACNAHNENSSTLPLMVKAQTANSERVAVHFVRILCHLHGQFQMLLT